MSSLPHQSGHDSGLGSGKKNRRSTSDMSSVAKEGKRWSSFATVFINSKKPSNVDANTFPGSSPSFVDNLRQLHKYSSKIKTAAENVNHVDSTWENYYNNRERCFESCKSLTAPQLTRRESSVVSPTTLTPPKSEQQRNLSLDTLNLVSVDTGSSTQSSSSRFDPSSHLSSPDDQYQKAAREWQTTVEILANSLRTSLQETYNAYGKDATPEGFERICTDKEARRITIYHMRNASISKMMSADLDFFLKYGNRFRNYDEIKKDLIKLRSLLSTAGIPQNKTIIERRISSTGDVMLEFANVESEEHPVFRFRVASHCLRETSSPIFGHMFNAHSRAELDDDIQRSLPLSQVKHVCADGNEVTLYRMPQTELNNERSLEILLHAAHNHDDRVPREVPFSQFVAIAQACLRYQCTSPLELFVEHRWLPYWREHATDDMVGDALLISYVFGLSNNFSHLSRIAILRMTGPCPSWPQKINEKIAAVRCAKIEQVYEQCRITLNEYLPAPPTDPISSAERSNANQSSEPRCPQGDRTCDTQNLGWFITILAQRGILSADLSSSAFFHLREPQNQSLLEIIDSLCLVTSPPQCHGGICDFAPAFRAAIQDIYKSVAGLTLYDISGKRGWALSKDRSPRQSTQSQNNGGGDMQEKLFKIAERTQYAPGDFRSSTALRGDGAGGHYDEDEDEDRDDVCFFTIMSLLDDPRDLHAAATINKRFYRSYLRNKTRLLEGTGKDIVEADGTPSRARVSSLDGESGGTAPSQEQLRHGQLSVVEGKRLVESDANKYPGHIRERLIGLRVGEDGRGGQSSARARGGR
ncbi:hypothetical protein F4678DRAFT_441463 [Xylaria arbuscula]|nr:hypothetical protein F4678DRAFT_441463 [Xylaria arbuscula]